jgi:tryptophan-rich sensory protein
MLFNALWNHLVFETRDLLVGLLGLIAFLAPLAILQVALVVHDRRAAAALAVYVAWVVLYDIPLFHALWRLNQA